ncbi:MAG: mechanosensitive ion channel [Clostridia bacterium]|nr:mechanosensitive ion channel [Clostridia bacterium]
MRELFNKIPHPWNIVAMISAIIIMMIVAFILTRINKHVFAKIQKNRSDLHLVFFEKLNSAVIFIACIIIALSAMGGIDSVWKTVLGGTAIISAVIAFAAQDVIKDILAGLMISIHKPFGIGDRIVLEDGTAGIVADITMRHVVLAGIDTLKIIIPNSKLNTMQLTNFSVGEYDRSVHFKFPVGYDTDLELAKKVIFNAVADSEYTIPIRKNESSPAAYSPVHFIEFADSALILEVTAYYEKSYKSEIIIDDVNMRVREALMANDIEIPYNYVTVVSKNG